MTASNVIEAWPESRIPGGKITTTQLGKHLDQSRQLFSPQRTTRTGTVEWVNTFCVSLPSTKPDTPRRPCEAITIKSHCLSFAASTIACQG